MTDRLHLEPRHRQLLEALLRKHLPDVDVWAYGSRVNGRSHDGSDLDLVLRGPDLAEIPADQLRDFEGAVRESTIPFLVEARDWARLPERFHREIERGYVALTDPPSSSTGDARTRARLGDCIEFNDATYSPRKDAWSFVNYLDTGNIIANRIAAVQRFDLDKDPLPVRARRKVRPGDIVLSTVRPNQRHFGILRDLPKNFLASTGFAVFRGQADVADTDYLYWFLTQDRIVDQLQTIAEHSTSAYPSIRPADIESLGIRLPPLAEQGAIAHILGALDDKIELNRRMNRTLEAMAQAIFKDWFVNFGPVRAKMEGRAPYLPPETWDLFPDRLVDSELGEIPEGWEVSEIGAEVDVVGGGTPSTKDPTYWNGGRHCWATPKDLSKLASTALLGTDRKITDAGVQQISSGLLPRGTVLLSSRAPIGYLAITEVPTAVNHCCPTNFVVWRVEVERFLVPAVLVGAVTGH